MNDLKKRIDEVNFARLNGMKHEPLGALLKDCRAEIERLEARIAELEKPYVGITHDEALDIVAISFASNDIVFVKNIEAAVINRYNEQRGVK